MNDKIWLDKVNHAYEIYISSNSLGTVDHFISWLYTQYGIVRPKVANNIITSDKQPDIL